MAETRARIHLPSVDRLLSDESARGLIERFGRAAVLEAVRSVVDAQRELLRSLDAADAPEPREILEQASARLARDSVPSLRRVFNLTGTLVHTNLGRALLPSEAIEAIGAVAGAPCNLEYDLDEGRRGERDAHLERDLIRLTGAEAATVVNNNAAAVLLVLNTLALRKEVPTSRGELIEIGGSFRLPEIMARAGCRLREVGTTNRTHLADFSEAIGPRTGAVMRAHASNYAVQGFSASVPEPDLAGLCRSRGVPLVVDQGSGTLVDLRAFGFPHEPTVREAIANGADLVTFSGDKLLGGPQAGIIVGRRDLVARLNRNPLKRALRLDKLRIAALAAVLKLAADPERLKERLPTLRALTRPLEEVWRVAERLRAALAPRLAAVAEVTAIESDAEFGSGALPLRPIPSVAVALTPRGARGRGTALTRLAASFRALPVPVIGRIVNDRFLLDCRALERESADALIDVLDSLKLGSAQRE